MASTYLLELSQRRQKLLSDAVNELGIPSGSVEHKIATTFAARSVTHHDQLDAQANEVSFLISKFSTPEYNSNSNLLPFTSYHTGMYFNPFGTIGLRPRI